MTIMPVFLKYPQEGAIVGHLLAGYGELEFLLAECLADHVHDEDAAFRLMFRVRLGGSSRIQAADSLMRNPLNIIGLGNEYSDAFGALKRCAEIRNQYAHCHWTEAYIATPRATLAFVNLEERYVKQTTKPIAEKAIDLNLLNEQESYFCYARDCLRFIHFETMLRQRRLLYDRNPFSMPPHKAAPHLHNP